MIKSTTRAFNFKDLTGQDFGRLTVLRHIGRDHKNSALWECRCRCGKLIAISRDNLRAGTQSCGCLQREKTSAYLRSHGKTNSPEYGVWLGLQKRCSNSKSSCYQYYGGRGIKVCKRWLGRNGFENFMTDMGSRPSSKHSIERKDNAGNYDPHNCVWATMKEQCRNRRSNCLVEFNGQIKTIAEWAEQLGLNFFTLYYRIRRSGWSAERALTAPVGAK